VTISRRYGRSNVGIIGAKENENKIMRKRKR
jgi:hypothetical protein